jgi:hypothetical protein
VNCKTFWTKKLGVAAGVWSFCACDKRGRCRSESRFGTLYAAALPGRLESGSSDSKDQLAIATDSIRDHLYVRAIVVDDGRNRAALVNIDGGARDGVVNPAIEKSSASTKCAPENYLISGTHSHSARINFKLGLLRIGDINFVTVNGEVYSKIALKLKDQGGGRPEAPANRPRMPAVV